MLVKKEANKLGFAKIGVVQMLSDNLIEPGSGFECYPDNNQEIITYIVNGELTHQDNLGNTRTLTRGHVLAMSTGSGIEHSQYNNSDKDLRILQMSIDSDTIDQKPQYSDFKYKWKLHANAWHEIVSSENGEAEVRINQDVSVNIMTLEEGITEFYAVDNDRQAYLVQVEGSSVINGIEMNECDGLKIISEDIEITATSNSHFLLIEMNKENQGL